MPTWAQVLIATLGLIGTATPGVLAFRAATRANRATEKLKERRADAEAFASAKGIYQDGIDELKRRLGEVRDELEREQRETQRLRGETRRLRGRVSKLEQALAGAGVPIPGDNEEGR